MRGGPLRGAPSSPPPTQWSPAIHHSAASLVLIAPSPTPRPPHSPSTSAPLLRKRTTALCTPLRPPARPAPPTVIAMARPPPRPPARHRHPTIAAAASAAAAVLVVAVVLAVAAVGMMAGGPAHGTAAETPTAAAASSAVGPPLTAQPATAAAYAAAVLAPMNRSVDPCVDFYAYACGGALARIRAAVAAAAAAAAAAGTPPNPIRGYQTTADALSRDAFAAVEGALQPGGPLGATPAAAYLASCRSRRLADAPSTAALRPYGAPLRDLLRATTVDSVYAALARLTVLPVGAYHPFSRVVGVSAGPPGGAACPTATFFVQRAELIRTAPANATGGGGGGGGGGGEEDPLALLAAAHAEGLLGNGTGGLAAAGLRNTADALAAADRFRAQLAPLVAAAVAADVAATGLPPANARQPFEWRTPRASAGGPLRLVAGVVGEAAAAAAAAGVETAAAAAGGERPQGVAPVLTRDRPYLEGVDALLRAAVRATAAWRAGGGGGPHPLAPLQAYLALAVTTGEAATMLGPALRRAAGAPAPPPPVGGVVTTPQTAVPACLLESTVVFAADIRRWYVATQRPPAARAAAAVIAGRVRAAMGALLRGGAWIPRGARGGEEAALATLRDVDGSEVDPRAEDPVANVTFRPAGGAYVANRVAAFGAVWGGLLDALATPCAAIGRENPLWSLMSAFNPRGAYDSKLHVVTVPAMLFSWPLLYVRGGSGGGGGSPGGGAGGRNCTDGAASPGNGDRGAGAAGGGAPVAYTYGRLGFVYGSAYASTIGPRPVAGPRGPKGWWTPAVSAAFVARSACMAAHYATLPIPDDPAGARVDGGAVVVQAARDATAVAAALGALRAERAAAGGGDGGGTCTSGCECGSDGGGGVGGERGGDQPGPGRPVQRRAALLAGRCPAGVHVRAAGGGGGAWQAVVGAVAGEGGGHGGAVARLRGRLAVPGGECVQPAGAHLLDFVGDAPPVKGGH
ncbi:hypothetical protein I4F81_002835 [Pyropia yezoensis]|uniref:Uncharacterized protein n=1 Tax=Pyropia yezoensis TaxID=2788 RepID=A0ACC3BRA5_PYRYE|nr:hypothetical protein I4F81_002835 [Neopyropia yezoensis]